MLLRDTSVLGKHYNGRILQRIESFIEVAKSLSQGSRHTSYWVVWLHEDCHWDSKPNRRYWGGSLLLGECDGDSWEWCEVNVVVADVIGCTIVMDKQIWDNCQNFSVKDVFQYFDKAMSCHFHTILPMLGAFVKEIIIPIIKWQASEDTDEYKVLSIDSRIVLLLSTGHVFLQLF